MTAPTWPGWTAEVIETLAALQAEGLSASQIGARLGCSRNAVIGKLHRLGLNGSPERRAVTAGLSGVNRRARAPKDPDAERAPRAPRLPAWQRLRIAPVASRDVTLAETTGGCSYPTGFAHDQHLFCDLPKRAASSYCPAHHRLCVIPAAPPALKVVEGTGFGARPASAYRSWRAA